MKLKSLQCGLFPIISLFFISILHAAPVTLGPPDANGHREIVSIDLPVSQQVSCVNGDPKLKKLVDQFENAKTTSIYKLIAKVDPQTAPPAKAEGDLPPPCIPCQQALNPQALKNIPAELFDNIKRYTQVKTRIKADCSLAAAGHDSGTSEIICPEKSIIQKTKIKNGRSVMISDGACVTSEMINYNNSAQENIYACFKKYSSSPITPASLFEIFSVESTYKANYSSTNGHGLGQLTDIFVRDAQQKGRGLGLLEKLALDSTPECDVAQKLASEDIGKTYRLPRDRCQFIQYGGGMERNMMFAMVGLNTLWEKNVSSYFSRYAKKYASDSNLPLVMEKVLQIAYGAGGPTAARAVINQNSDLTPNEFLERLSQPMNTTSGGKLTQYLANIAERQVSISKDLVEPLKSEFLKNGARACIE
jgi:hypothetical protein